MTRKKKTPPPEKETLAPGIERFTFGNRIVRQSYISVNNEIASRDDCERFGVGWRPNFELAIAADIEREAKNILEKAGLPIDPGDPCPITDKEIFGPMVAIMRAPLYLDPGGFPTFLPIRPREKCLVQLVEDSGCRKREDPRWYAAAILYTLWSIRMHSMPPGNDMALVMAYKLGNLVAEAKALGFFARVGGEGQQNRKPQKSPWPTLANYLLRNYPDGTDEHRFGMVPDIKKDDDLPIKNRYRFYRKDGRIHAEMKVKGEWKLSRKTLKLSGLRRRLTEARRHRDR